MGSKTRAVRGTKGQAGVARKVGARRIVLGENEYGKSRVRMVKVERRGSVHTVREFEVNIALIGDFARVHTHGENANCLPTDTMKNTVYALGKKHAIGAIEEFAVLLGKHFLRTHAAAEGARVEIHEVSWKRARVKGREHPHCFLQGSGERKTCSVMVDREGAEVRAGIEGMVIMKSAGSAFSGYPKDGYTTLQETRDRIFCTSMSVMWEYRAGERVEYDAVRERVRETLIEAFAGHESESVQHTLYAMGERALKVSPEVECVRISMPNKHCLLVNLQAFGMKNANEVFVPTDEPHGLIEATVRRE